MAAGTERNGAQLNKGVTPGPIPSGEQTVVRRGNPVTEFFDQFTPGPRAAGRIALPLILGTIASATDGSWQVGLAVGAAGLAGRAVRVGVANHYRKVEERLAAQERAQTSLVQADLLKRVAALEQAQPDLDVFGSTGPITWERELGKKPWEQSE